MKIFLLIICRVVNKKWIFLFFQLVAAMEPPNEITIIETKSIKIEPVQGEKAEMQLIDLDSNSIFGIFDLLSLSEVCSMSFTCQKMQQLANEYFAYKFSDQWITIEIEPKDDSTAIAFSKRNMKVLKYFSKCIRNVQIINTRAFSNKCPMDLQCLYAFLRSECPTELHSLDLRFEVKSTDCIDTVKSCLDNNPPENDDIKNQLKNVENIIVSKSDIHSTYQGLIKYCENVKFFKIKTPNAYGWFEYKFPKLESLSLSGINEKQCHSIDAFFQHHQQIKEITCNGINMLEAVCRNFNRLDRLQANIELPNQLRGIIQDLRPKLIKKNFKWFGLEFTLPCIPDAGILMDINALVPIHRLEFDVTLQIFERASSSHEILRSRFPYLKDLEELKMKFSFQEMGTLNMISANFPNIKCLELVIDHLYLCGSNSLLFKNAMVPLVRDLLRMKMLILSFEGGTITRVIFDPMDLAELESIRRSVPGASNLKIHVKHLQRDLRQKPKFQTPETMVTINFDIHTSSVNF